MATRDTRAAVGRYLTLLLNGGAYGIAAEKVREIIHGAKVMPLTQFSRHIRGTINLRGRIIPVMDLRSRLGLLWQSHERSCIVIVQVHGYEDTPVMMGFAVDQVDDVLGFGEEEITAVAESVSNLLGSIVRGSALRDGRQITLLDIDGVVAPELAPSAD